MPTYEYRCLKGHHFDLFQKMSEDPRTECPECGAESERQISGGTGFLFKGDGFYITDSRSDSYKKEAAKEDSSGAPDKATPKKPAKAGESPSTPAKVQESVSTSSSSGESSSEGS